MFSDLSIATYYYIFDNINLKEHNNVFDVMYPTDVLRSFATVINNKPVLY